MTEIPKPENRFWNPYLAGLALGLVLLASFLIMGKGLGASGPAARLGVFVLGTAAPGHIQARSYLAHYFEGDRSILHNYFVFELLGMFLGGLASAYAVGRVQRRVIRGPRVSVSKRLTFALIGGVLMGVAARFGRGCTSGQALSGGAMLSVGSWVFMMCIFGGAYALAYWMRRQWT